MQYHLHYAEVTLGTPSKNHLKNPKKNVTTAVTTAGLKNHPKNPLGVLTLQHMLTLH